MNLKHRNRVGLALVSGLAILTIMVLVGCSGRDLTELELATAPVDPVVFADGFLGGLDYSAFEFSHYTALSIDQLDTYEGTHSLKFTIPAGLWAGGSFWTQGPRDLSGFTALTFYAKAGQPMVVEEVGYGIPIVAPETYKASVQNIELGTDWQRYVIPIPDPGKLTQEQGMFWFSDGGDPAREVQFWFDEVEFARVSGLTNKRPTMDDGSVEALQGESVPLPDGVTTFNVNGTDVSVTHTSAYFTFFSSDENVVLGGAGSATAVNGGTATLTAQMDGIDVDGEITVTVIGPPSEPAPTPASAPGDVISLYSDVYDDIVVDTWRAEFSTSGEVYDQNIGDDNVKGYIGLNTPAFTVIEFIENQIDAATPEMTHFHLDVYAPEGSFFQVKLVDFGPNGVFDGPDSDDSERPLTFSSFSDPVFAPGQWVSLDIPLTQFEGMNFGNLAQLILSGDVGNVWIDNVYFRK